MSILQEIRRYQTSPQAKNFILVFAANIFAAVCSFGYTVWISHRVDQGTFGVVSVVLALVQILIGITDLGIGTSFVQFLSSLWNNPAELDRARALARRTLWFEVAIGAALAVCIVAAAPWLNNAIFHEAGHVAAIRWSGILAGVLSASAIFPALFQSRQSFRAYAFWLAMPAVARLVVVGGLASGGAVSPVSILIWFVVIAAIIFFVTLWLTWKTWIQIPSTPSVADDFRRLLKFTRWVAASFLVTSMMGRIDVLILPRFVSSDQVGVYAAAMQLLLGFQLLMSAINTIALPICSRLQHRDELVQFVRSMEKLTWRAAALSSIIILIARYIVQTVFGHEYLSATLPLQLLSGGLILGVLALPYSLSMYRYHRPDIAFWLNAAQLVLLVMGDLVMIPRIGIIGPAATNLTVVCLSFVASVIIYRHLVKREVPAQL